MNALVPLGQSGTGPDLLIWIVLAPLCLVLAVIDLRTHTLPTRLIAPGYGWVGAVIVIGAVTSRDLTSLRNAVVGWLLVGGFFLALWWVRSTGMGYGDVRLAGLLGLALGHQSVSTALTGLYLSFLLGGVWAVTMVLRHRRDQAFAFGPFMVVGALIASVWAPPLALVG